MRVFGIDPGTRVSGVIVYDSDEGKVVRSDEVDNLSSKIMSIL